MFNLSGSKNFFYFSELLDLGIYNFCTTQLLGNLNHTTNPDADKITKDFIYKNLLYSKKYFLFSPESADQIFFLTEDNIIFYNTLNTDKNSLYHKIYCDGIITTENVPIVITPADCAILVLVSELKDKRKILAVSHLGFIGAILKLHLKTIDFLKKLYNVNNLKAFIFPYIFGENYIKDFLDSRIQYALRKDSSWSKYFLKTGKSANYVEIHFVQKIVDDLKSLKVDVFDSKINTYSENSNNRLYSLTYLRENNLDISQRFAVIIYNNN